MIPIMNIWVVRTLMMILASKFSQTIVKDIYFGLLTGNRLPSQQVLTSLAKVTNMPESILRQNTQRCMKD